MYTHRVEKEFTQRKGKYHTSHQNHPTLTKQIRGHTNQHFQEETKSNNVANRVRDRRKSLARRQR